MANPAQLLRDWHLCFNHLNCVDIIKLEQQQIVKDLKITDKSEQFKCEACLMSKSHKQMYTDQQSIHATRAGERIHMDICYVGKPSLGKSTYFITVTNDYSCYSWVFPLKQKSNVVSCIQEFLNYVMTHTGHNVQYLRSDNEFFINRKVNKLCQQLGTHQEATTAYTSQQDSVAEHKNQTLLDGIRAMLQQSAMNHEFWFEAAQYLVYTRIKAQQNYSK